MKRIRSALRDRFDVGTRAASIRSVVVDGENREFLHRFDTGSDNSRTAPFQTIHAHSVHQIVIRSDTLSVGTDGRLVFDLENRCVRPARAGGATDGSRAIRKSGGASVAETCAVPENTGSQTNQFVGVAVDFRQTLNFDRRNRPLHIGVFGFKCRRCAGYGHSFTGRPSLQCNVRSGSSLGANLHIGSGTFLEAGGFHIKLVVARRESRNPVETCGSGNRTVAHAGCLVSDRHGGAGDDGPALVGHGALQACTVLRHGE